MPQIVRSQRPTVQPFVLLVVATATRRRTIADQTAAQAATQLNTSLTRPIATALDAALQLIGAVRIVSRMMLAIYLMRCRRLRLRCGLLMVVLLLLLRFLLLPQRSATEPRRIAAVLTQRITDSRIRRIPRRIVVQMQRMLHRLVMVVLQLLMIVVMMGRHPLRCRVIRRDARMAILTVHQRSVRTAAGRSAQIGHRIGQHQRVMQMPVMAVYRVARLVARQQPILQRRRVRAAHQLAALL